ncbi:MAG TPA: phenylacetic acid degradation operon negative regulatory protein PaaX [Dehalococcoidia bacterium]|nr:phenylacetic acid degradation operon negative regulatory protein PaaX [Dehalococcoidia bacterium]
MFGPRAAMLTLYGDYVLHRGGEIGIGSLVRLLSNFGLSEQAIRSAVSRMCRSGLLKAKRSNRKSYYSLTNEGHSLLTEGAQRIFQRKESRWDGNWNIVTYSIPERKRQARDRLRLELGLMGYGALGEATWISPYDLTREVKNLLERLNIEEYVNIFSAQHQGGTDPRKIVSHCWDLGKIHQKYVGFLGEYHPKLEEHRRRLENGETIESSECFVARFNLIHEYRKLPFSDPDLPLELLPDNWLRPQATALFNEYRGLLTEKANEYFDSVSRKYRGARRAKHLAGSAI